MSVNKLSLKNFAKQTREVIIKNIEVMLRSLSIRANGEITVKLKYNQLFVNGIAIPLSPKVSFNNIHNDFEQKGYKTIVEKLAYCWFKYLIIISYLDKHQLLDSIEKEEPIVSTVKDGLRKESFYYQCLIIKKAFPFMFTDQWECDVLLYLLKENADLTQDLIDPIYKRNDLEIFQNIEGIGWLYQFYYSDAKDEVYRQMKQNIKLDKHAIPRATQLFTPHWISQYLLENTLGRIYLELNDQSRLRDEMPYYIDSIEQEDTVRKKLEAIRLQHKHTKLEHITIMDPCVGAGHILLAAFDLLYEMYVESGYSHEEIPKLILEKNLYGLDIDEEAVHIATFALLMKACKYTKRILQQPVNLNIHCIQETTSDSYTVIINNLEDPSSRSKLNAIIQSFQDAKIAGSLVHPPRMNYEHVFDSVKQLKSNLNEISSYKLRTLLTIAELLSMKYDVVITNPPYMGMKGMNKKLSQYLKENYPDSKADLFASFIERICMLTKENGFAAILTQQSWMFLTSFEKLRKKLLENTTIYSMIHLGKQTFEEIAGEVVQSTTFILRNGKIPGYRADFYRLVDYPSPQLKQQAFLERKNVFRQTQDLFLSLPNYAVVYWANEKWFSIYNTCIQLKKIAEPKQGLATANNERYLRLWFEVDYNKIQFTYPTEKKSRLKWFPYNKGGSYRKWYGNQEYVINWENNGQELKNDKRAVIRNEQFYFKEGITWSFVSSDKFGVRYTPAGFLFDVGGSSIFTNNEQLYPLLGLLGSKCTEYFLKMMNPTMNYQVGNIAALPVANWSNQTDEIEKIVKECIAIQKREWDSYELSWNFIKHPLLLHQKESDLIEEAFLRWQLFTTDEFNQLKKNEERLNKIFIKLYGLEDELIPTCQGQTITYRLANHTREAKSFLSYFIGCLLGRYSLDVDRIAFAGGSWDETKYKSFAPAQDGLICLNSEFDGEENIIRQLRNFLTITFSEDTVDENLAWLADALGKRRGETAVERISRYFMDEFYTDHCQLYRKRPIYWQFQSGVEKSIVGIAYLHRLQLQTLNRFKEKYVDQLLSRYTGQYKELLKKDTFKNKQKERNYLVREMKKKERRIQEIEAYIKKLTETISHPLLIDLDNGVKINYEKLASVLAEIK